MLAPDHYLRTTNHQQERPVRPKAHNRFPTGLDIPQRVRSPGDGCSHCTTVDVEEPSADRTMSTTSTRISPAAPDSVQPGCPVGRQLHGSRRARRAANKSAETASNNRRTAVLRPVIVVLQAGAVLALLGLILGVLWSQTLDPGGEFAVDGRPALARGQVARRTDVDGLPACPRPIDDPDRIKGMLPIGGTHEALLKGGFVTFARDRDFGAAKCVHLAFAFEALTRRTIESNDGRRIVEILAFERVLAAKLLSEADDLTMDLGPPGVSVFQTLDHLRPDAGTTIVPARPVAEAILAPPAEAVAGNAASRAFLQVGSLSGKRLRITYVDGIGVESIEPIGCQLTASEGAYLFHTAVLRDAYLLPSEKVPPGATWKVDGSQMVGLFGPSIRGVPQGELVVERLPTNRHEGKQYADLQIRGDELWTTFFSCGRRCPISMLEGTFRFDRSDGRIETASIRGELPNWPVSNDLPEEHLLFRVDSWLPTILTVSYSCQARVCGSTYTAR